MKYFLSINGLDIGYFKTIKEIDNYLFSYGINSPYDERYNISVKKVSKK